MLLDKVIDEATGYSRVDVVFDVYDPQSIKSDERTKRGSQKMCNIRILNGAMNIPKSWNDFLTNINNKNELVSFLIDSWKGMVPKIPVGQKFIVSGTGVHHLTEELEGCLSVDHLKSNHDEADTRLLLHAADILKSVELAVIRTVDTDVLVLALHHFHDMVESQSTQDVVMNIGTGNHRRYISIGQLCRSMPEGVRANILAAYALTGCDTTNALFRITKAKAVTTLEGEEYHLETLGDPKDPLSEACKEGVQKIYSRTVWRLRRIDRGSIQDICQQGNKK